MSNLVVAISQINKILDTEVATKKYSYFSYRVVTLFAH